MPIIFTKGGRTVVVNPAPGFDPEAVAAQTVPDGIEWRIVTDEEALAILTAEAAPTLEHVKAAAVERINREAGDQRGKHITVTTGQSATYIEKQKEAERYAAGGEGPFWYLEAEAEATGDTVEAVAALVLATADAWTRLNAAIEGKRRGALVALDKATTAEEVASIFPIAWPG